MKPEGFSEQFVRNLLLALPYWNSKIVRPFRESLNREMSLETYYCLETLRQIGPSTMTELAAVLKVPKQQVTKLADKLCQCEFVERIHDEKDRRLVRIRLTDMADTYIGEYFKKNAVFVNGLEQQLSEEDLIKLNDAVATLSEVLPRLN